MAFSFFGGVHPNENKWYACDKETVVFPEPDIVTIPMSQHIGAPCKPLVKKGDLVTVGQKIGDNQGLCVPVHASVSGKVKAVEARPHTNGSTGQKQAGSGMEGKLFETFRFSNIFRRKSDNFPKKQGVPFL